MSNEINSIGFGGTAFVIVALIFIFLTNIKTEYSLLIALVISLVVAVIVAGMRRWEL